MELKDFIKEALIQVVTGVEEAREALQGKGILINPLINAQGGVDVKRDVFKGERKAQSLEFSIAVTTESKEGKKAGLGVLTGFLSAEAGKSTENGAIAYNSLKFSIPFSLPFDVEPKTKY